MRKLMGAGLCAAALLGVANAGSPAISTRWGRTQLSQDACLDNAERAIRAAGFTRREPTKTSRYGSKGDFVIVIRCLTDLGMYFMASAGPDQRHTDANVDAVDKGF